jgi:3-oxoacyl-[acyl-carrier protein] reductase
MGIMEDLHIQAPKLQLLILTKTLSKELGIYNIRVNSISPGLTDTDLMKSNTKEEIIENEFKKFLLKELQSKRDSSVIFF